jgi:hypothetical protein
LLEKCSKIISKFFILNYGLATGIVEEVGIAGVHFELA